MDWTAGANLLKGVYNTLLKFSYIAHLPHLKVCFLGDPLYCEVSSL